MPLSTPACFPTAHFWKGPGTAWGHSSGLSVPTAQHQGHWSGQLGGRPQGHPHLWEDNSFRGPEVLFVLSKRLLLGSSSQGWAPENSGGGEGRMQGGIDRCPHQTNTQKIHWQLHATALTDLRRKRGHISGFQLHQVQKQATLIYGERGQ